LWLDKFSLCHNESDDDTTVEAPAKIATKVMRGNTGKLVRFHYEARKLDEKASNGQFARIETTPIASTSNWGIGYLVTPKNYQYKGLPHLCTSRQRRKALEKYDVHKAFERFTSHFTKHHVDGSDRVVANHEDFDSYVKKLELNTFTEGDPS
jgi:hypothetical protein